MLLASNLQHQPVLFGMKCYEKTVMLVSQVTLVLRVPLVLYKSCYDTVSNAQYCKLVSSVSIVGSHDRKNCCCCKYC